MAESRTQCLLHLRNWLNDERLWESPEVLGPLGLAPPTEGPGDGLVLEKDHVDALVAIVAASRQGLPVPPPGLSPDDAKEPGSREPTLADLLDVRSCYNDALGRPSDDLETLADTHMTGDEIIRAQHYRASRVRNVRQRAEAINRHREEALAVTTGEAAMRSLIAEGELHRLECVRFSDELNRLCDEVRGRPALRAPSGRSPFQAPPDREYSRGPGNPGPRYRQSGTARSLRRYRRGSLPRY